MLTLRLKRTGRKKLPQYRLIAQEHRLSPSSGKVAAYLGSYNPHTKDFNFDKEKTESLLANGAQPSNRVAILLSKAGLKLPKWVVITQKPEKKKPEAEVEAKPTEVKDETEGTAPADDIEEAEASVVEAEQPAEEPKAEEETAKDEAETEKA